MTNETTWTMLRSSDEECAMIARTVQPMMKLAVHTAVMITLVRMNIGLSQNSRGVCCLAMPRVKGLPIASEMAAIRPSAPLAMDAVYACSAVCGSANASTVSAAKEAAEP